MSDIDEIALDVVKAIGNIDPDKLPGGRTQALAQAQILVRDAISGEVEALKAANRDLQDWFDDARATAEQAQARVAELEHSLTELIQHYSETWDHPILQRAEAARNGSGYPWLLRKQAEAVEFVTRSYVQEGMTRRVLLEHAEIFRQQADDMEQNNDSRNISRSNEQD